MKKPFTNRRNFIRNSALMTSGLISIPLISNASNNYKSTPEGIYMIGPQEGYTPMIGTLLSTMTLMRTWVKRSAESLTVDQLDFQIDDKSNSIGAMLLHLASTERYYQLNTFENLEWGTWSDEIKQEWDVGMDLGEAGREKIIGNDIDFYFDKLDKVRENTQIEFAKRDDNWLMSSENFFDNLPTNNHAKWFHVCEHESNHNGQIKFIKKRIPDL